MNKLDLTKKIRGLKDLSQDEKSFLINVVNTKKKYGLVWEDKIDDVEEELRQKFPVFVEVKDKLVFNGHDNPNHVLIEGDNLHALTALTFTHEGRVDVVYIDPPYNRGENDFRYNDNWIQKDNPFKHSLWLSFISKRLKIAKRLLNETGVIIIHIDEHEFDALNLLLETEIFGEENSLGQIIYNKQNPKGDAKSVATMHEYVLIYCKNKFEFLQQANVLSRRKPNAMAILNKAKRLYAKLNKRDIPEDIKEIVKTFSYSKEILKDFEVTYDLELINKEFQSWLSRQDFSGGERAYRFIDDGGKVYRGVSMAWPNKEDAPEEYKIPLRHPVTGKECPMPRRGWRNPPSTMQKLLDKNLILFGEDERKQPERKYLLEENMFENTPSIYNNGSSNDNLLNDLGISFPYPKPIEVAKYFLQSIHPNPKIIVDFFAGSGTTLHAAMELNREDDNNRQCILITNNENKICEEVTYIRNQKIITGYTNPQGSFIKGLLNNNLRYYKSAYVSRELNISNKRKLTRLATELLCIKENCYENITKNYTSDLENISIYYDGGEKYLFIIYDDAIVDEGIELLKSLIANNVITHPVKVYVFSNGQYPYTEEFEEILSSIELCALPDVIYKAYRNVLPVKERDDVPELEEPTTQEVELDLQQNITFANFANTRDNL